MAMASNMAVFGIARCEIVVYKAVGSKTVLSEVVVCETAILEAIAHKIAVCEVWVAISGKSCSNIASKAVIGT